MHKMGELHFALIRRFLLYKCTIQRPCQFFGGMMSYVCFEWQAQDTLALLEGSTLISEANELDDFHQLLIRTVNRGDLVFLVPAGLPNIPR